jgi:Universal stress protein family
MDRIVVGVDGSPAATAAARWAACEAAMRNVELTIVHVLRSAPDAWPLTGWPAIPLPAEVGEGQFARGEPRQSSPRPSVRGNSAASVEKSASARSYTVCASPRRARNVPHDETRRFLVCCWRRRVAKGFNRIGSATALLLTDAVVGSRSFVSIRRL